MSNSPYAIVVDGNTGDVSEHVLGNHMAGTKLQNTSVTIVSNTVVEDVRTVVMTRALKGITTQHHTFDPNKLLTNIISAYGTTTSLSYHKSKETAALHLWPLSSSSSTCVCSLPAAPFGKGTGTLTYLPSGETIGFPFRCNVDVDESVLHDRNPTCDIRTYLGGLSTCHHAWHLIDAGKYSSERAAREWSTVVDISITPPSFKPVSLSLSRSPLSKTPKQVFFFNVINILSLLPLCSTFINLLFSFNVTIF